jgi:hypothetical protein
MKVLPKVLTDAQVRTFERDGAFPSARWRRFEALEARSRHQEDENEVPSPLPVGARDRRGPHILDIFET